jgi:twitching motility protein PilT
MTDDANQKLLERYLLAMVAAKASDLFLGPRRAPSLRINGQLVTYPDLAPPTAEQMRAFVALLLTPLAAGRFEESPDIDVGYAAGRDRFRVSLFMHQGELGLVARLIPAADAARFEALNLPPIVLNLAEQRRGLVLVVGPTGSGKSTTLASLLHHINSTRPDHIVTVEDPIEFVHEPILALIHQRQVGYDTADFATAIRHVVRQSPDVVLIGEMRDHETMDAALSVALTGHLVLSSLHTSGVAQSIDRLLNYFPGDQRRQVQVDLGQTLVGMVSMRLVPRADGTGRVPAVEVLIGTPLVRRTIAEGRFIELPDLMKKGRDAGMITLNQSLAELCRGGVVDEADALLHSQNPDELRLLLQGMTTGTDSIERRRF